MARNQIKNIQLMKAYSFERSMKMISIRLAEYKDFEFFYELKSEDFNIFWTGGSSKPEKNNLRKFFYDAIDNAEKTENRKIFIVENEDRFKVGHLYIRPNGEEFELAVAIVQKYGGKGYAKEAIKLGLEEGRHLGFKRMITSIREDNIASMKAYTACGVKVLDDYKEVFIPKLGKNVKMYIVIYDYGDASFG